MNCKCNVIILILAFISSAHCQETIPGSVFDGDTKQGIPYAAVHLMGSYSGTSCNEAGRFLLHVPKGKEHSKVVVSSLGYGSDTVSVQALIKKKGKVVLKPNAIQLSGVTITEYATARKLMETVVKRIPQNYRTDEAVGIWHYRNRQMVNDSLFVQSEGLTRNYMPAYGNMLKLKYYFDLIRWNEELYRLYQSRDTIMVYNREYWRRLVGPEPIDEKLHLETFNKPSDFYGTISTDFVNYMKRKDLRIFSKKSMFVMETFSQDGKDFYRVTIAFKPKGQKCCDTAIVVISRNELAVEDVVHIHPFVSYRSICPSMYTGLHYTAITHWRYQKYNDKYQLDFIQREYEHFLEFSSKAAEAGCRVPFLRITGREECILSEYTTEGVEEYKQRYYDNEHPRTVENLQETERILRQPHNKIPW